MSELNYMSEENERQRDEKVDIAILARGGIRCYHKMHVLEYDVQLLSDKGYTIIDFEGEYITTHSCPKQLLKRA